VDSGELVATTVLGAEHGFRLLWLILVSCTIKTVVQNELGRYAIGTGETTLEAFDRVPGPRWRVSWVVGQGAPGRRKVDQASVAEERHRRSVAWQPGWSRQSGSRSRQ